MNKWKSVGFMALAVLLGEGTASAEPMIFKQIGEPGNCRQADCGSWIQANGDITENTPSDFLAYFEKHPYAPKIIRFDSPGGNLEAGLKLGTLIRKLGFSTRADFCASACAYAFMGGVERQLAGRQKLGVHRFYTQKAIENPTDKQFTGDDLDVVQKQMAALMIFALNMDIDLRVIALSGESGPAEMRWLTNDEAIDLKMVFSPSTWKAWSIEGDDNNDSYVAASETQDGRRTMQISCTADGAHFALFDEDKAPVWFEQCNTQAAEHYVLGKYVPAAQTLIKPWGERGTVVIFNLPPGSLDYSNPSLYSESALYSQACIDSLGEYEGTTSRLKTMATIALSRCESSRR